MENKSKPAIKPAAPEEKQADRVWFSASLKLNMGDYESADIGYGMTTSIEPGETIESAFKRVRIQVTHEVEAEALRIRNGKYKKVLLHE